MNYLAALLLLVLSFSAGAVIETYEFSSSELEQRYHLLSQELRCPKCQNQNIADSNAPISQDLRKQLYQQLEAGASDAEILDYMVARYGEFVRYRPAMSGVTIVLWAAPLLLLALALALAFSVLRSRRSNDEQQTLSSDEQKQLDELLARERDA
ncbi:cytochrome c-type biogenesis protein [Sediminihaliea albiluteola]|nr:cytochrome c-type biogenesis protein [Sediminihaliea albiluteola]